MGSSELIRRDFRLRHWRKSLGSGCCRAASKKGKVFVTGKAPDISEDVLL